MKFISKQEAKEIAEHHVSVWNTHDLEKIMSLYSESIVLASPLAEKITGTPSVNGKAAVRDYFGAGIKKYPDLHFSLMGIYVCVNTIVLHMTGANNNSLCEVLHFNSDGQIEKVMAHYEC
ncbi:nuclear transport factor 2 family protein [Cellvibrio sp. KY-GH-1]|uniref:nuclear transport factor 2 family protein n=1 Tax=Cellvibrio sp. KY-GH-1 TaxID=2303332 RepID=UPI0012475A8D|nr:nuclear transport factor 2 family protein [Cellvibrio sp. KY-GH-1]QEY16780.1 nuclear transport factor 2 family protein [Cellvibrio sp. KY-GH-1]